MGDFMRAIADESERFLEAARAHFDVRTTMSPRFQRVAIHRLRVRPASAR